MPVQEMQIAQRRQILGVHSVITDFVILIYHVNEKVRLL